ncbi:hypothetical protein ACQ4LE_009164 [Meloidogyne hapla]
MLDNMKGGHRVYTIERLKFFNTNFDSELKKFFLCNFLISALYRGFLTLSIVVPSRSIQINNVIGLAENSWFPLQYFWMNFEEVVISNSAVDVNLLKISINLKFGFNF